MHSPLRLALLLKIALLVITQQPVAAQQTLNACDIYAEQAGLITMETESTPPVDEWSLQSEVDGSLGVGYLEWKHGSDSQGIDKAGGGVLTFTFNIQTAGTYRFLLRSAAPHNTEHNDVWARFPQNKVYGRKSNGSSEVDLGQDSWFKVYQNKGGNNWNWQASTVDHNAHNIFAEFSSPGTYTLQLSGRSTLFKVDRIVLFHESVEQSAATNNNNLESPCDDGGGENLRPPQPPANTAPGLQYAYYEGEWTEIPDFNAIEAIKTGATANIDLSLRDRADHYAFLFTGYIDAPSDGIYSFFTASDDGSQLFIGDQLVVNNDGVHAATESQGFIGLQKGLHPITIYFFERTGQDSLSVSWTAPGQEKELVSANALVYDTDDLLPVELTSFEAFFQSTSVLLTWETASELNNAGFDIERAVGSSTSFESVGFVSGAGSTLHGTRYTYRDETAPREASTVSYRLKQVDFDGTFSYSPVVTISIPIEQQLQLHPNYPNPYNPTTTITFSLPLGDNARLDIFDTSGRLVETILDQELDAGFHEVTYSAPSSLSSGNYVYRLTTSRQTLSGTMLLLK